MCTSYCFFHFLLSSISSIHCDSPPHQKNLQRQIVRQNIPSNLSIHPPPQIKHIKLFKKFPHFKFNNFSQKRLTSVFFRLSFVLFSCFASSTKYINYGENFDLNLIIHRSDMNIPSWNSMDYEKFSGLIVWSMRKAGLTPSNKRNQINVYIHPASWNSFFGLYVCEEGGKGRSEGERLQKN